MFSVDVCLTPARKSKLASVTKKDFLLLFWEIFVVYSENNMKYINTLCCKKVDVLSIKINGTYTYHCNLKC
jgi:hypothetical protein